MVQPMEVPSHRLQLRVIVGLNRRLPLDFQLPHRRFRHTLVEPTNHFVVLMGHDPERLAHRREEVFFVELGVPFGRFVI